MEKILNFSKNYDIERPGVQIDGYQVRRVSELLLPIHPPIFNNITYQAQTRLFTKVTVIKTKQSPGHTLTPG
jgi:hypothetical protein